MSSGSEWISLATAAFSGGLIVKFLDIVYLECRRHFDRKASTHGFVDDHLAPLLKAADEMFGKLHSLAKDDFKALYDINPNIDNLRNSDFSGLLFLFAKFWASIEIIRYEGLSISFAEDERGRKLQNFMDCIESKKIRIVDRISQRAVGELMMKRQNDKFRTITFIEFVSLVEGNIQAKRWIEPVAAILSKAKNTSERQTLLQYGIVIHALIDTLDSEHKVTRCRPSFSGKLSKKTRNDLKYRVFGQYLKFVSQPEKYLGPPKG